MPSEVRRPREVAVGRRRVRVTNPDKVLYPDAGFTKGEVVDYYLAIGDVLLPHVRDRPLTLKRFPNGVAAGFFYEKHCPPHRPGWVQTSCVYVHGRRREIPFCLANDKATLVWLANLADLELHTGLATVDDLNRPTALVFDLDPGPGTGVRECARVALALRERLARSRLSGFVKTSGSKGLQLYVPLNGAVAFDQMKALARALGDELAEEQPDAVTTKMSRSERPGRVFVDWSQNSPHKTTIAAYSLRGTPEPSVSMPLEWAEVERAARTRGTGVLRFTPRQALQRVQEHGDLFEGVLSLRQSLPA